MFVSCFIPEYDAIFNAQKIAKRIVLFSCFTQFWACNEADEPHFSALYTPKLHLCTLVPLPGTPVSHTPKHHLGCPILLFGVSHFPFGVSHFTIRGIFSAHLSTIHRPMPDLASSFSLQKFVCFLFSTGKSTHLSYCKNIYTLTDLMLH